MGNDHKYEIILYWSNDDNAFIAEVPELPGCAADGATYGKALANVGQVIAEWIETARELGRAIPAPAADYCTPNDEYAQGSRTEPARHGAGHRDPRRLEGSRHAPRAVRRKLQGFRTYCMLRHLACAGAAAGWSSPLLLQFKLQTPPAGLSRRRARLMAKTRSTVPFADFGFVARPTGPGDEPEICDMRREPGM